jgi:hypothetical protein
MYQSLKRKRSEAPFAWIWNRTHNMIRTLLLVGLALAAIVPCASAQTVFNPNPPIGAPYSRPALSPYLNLLRGGDPAANYYLGVMTEFDRRYQQSRLAPVDAPRLTPMVDDRADLEVGDRQLPPTGHPTGFMIYNSFYRLPNQRSFVPYNPNQQGPRY